MSEDHNNQTTSELAAPEAPELVSTSEAEVGSIVSIEEMLSQIISGLQLFVVAVKNCGLYPPNSAIRKDSFDKLFNWFHPFLEEYESLRLFVDPSSLLYQGLPVHKDKPNEPNLIFPLFRDGIQWLEFNEGLTVEELETFIGFLNRYRMLREDDEDDLVTAMWAADFQSIKYKTANEFWDIDPVTEITALTAGPGLSAGQGLGLASQGTPNGPGGLTALFDLAKKITTSAKKNRQILPNLPDLGDLPISDRGGGTSDEDDEPDPLRLYRNSKLQQSERSALDELVVKEIRGLSLIESLEPVLDLLWRLRTLSQAQNILTFLLEAIKFGFASGSFAEIHQLFRRVSQISTRAAPRLEGVEAEFYRRLANYEVLECLTLFKKPTNQPYSEEKNSQILDEILSILPPEAIKELARVTDAAEPMVTTCVLRAIAARQNFTTPEIGAFINANIKPAALIELVGILKNLPQNRELLVAISRHLSTQVREAAALTVLESDPSLISLMTHILIETDPSLNRRIYSYLGSQRNSTVEKVLLNFLNMSYQTSIQRNENTLANGYRALGLAATTAATADFCIEVLNKKSLRALFGLGSEQEMLHRTGAALALILMGRQDSVASSSRSFFKTLRTAARAAEFEASRVTQPHRRPPAARS
ncbi:MAG: hypothetical protein LBT47_07565 [Deltaproteobacteria bacterium]|jgi:hypothetical protein|nr:hypothetical protein [Deltaproteobacteria bacterium]